MAICQTNVWINQMISYSQEICDWAKRQLLVRGKGHSNCENNDENGYAGGGGGDDKENEDEHHYLTPTGKKI